jgi:Rap1a immunity proteins
MIRICASAIISLCFLVSANAQNDPWTGKDFLEGCRAASIPFSEKNPDTIEAGICAGAISALAWTLSDKEGMCISRKSVQEEAKVVVSYLDRNPTKLNEPLLGLILMALVDAWHCPATQKSN